MCDASNVGKGMGVEELRAKVEEIKTEVEELKTTTGVNVGKLGTLEEDIIPELMNRLLRLERGEGRGRRVTDGEELLEEDEGRKLMDINKSGGEEGAGEDNGGGNTGAGAGDTKGGASGKKTEEPAPSIMETLEILRVARRGNMGKRDVRFAGRWLVEDLANNDSVFVGPWLKFLIADRGLERAEVAAMEEIAKAGERVLAGLKNATPQVRANARLSTVLPRELLSEELEARREGGSLLLFEHRLIDIVAWDRAVREETYTRYVGLGGEKDAGDAAMNDLERSLMCTGTRQVYGEHFLYVGKTEYRAIGERLAGVGRTVDLRHHGEQASKLAYGMARRLKLERGAGDTSGDWSMTGERLALVVTLGAVGAAVAENRNRAAYLRDCCDFYGNGHIMKFVLKFTTSVSGLPISPDANLALLCGAGGHKWWGCRDSSPWWGTAVAR